MEGAFFGAFSFPVASSRFSSNYLLATDPGISTVIPPRFVPIPAIPILRPSLTEPPGRACPEESLGRRSDQSCNSHEHAHVHVGVMVSLLAESRGSGRPHRDTGSDRIATNRGGAAFELPGSEVKRTGSEPRTKSE